MLYFLIELIEHEPGTSERDTVCKCNGKKGYVPVNDTKHFGQVSKDECFFQPTSTANETGLCCH